MSSLRRPFTTVLQGASSGRVTQSLPTRLSSSMSVVGPAQEYEAFTILPIFDIFDAPVRLGESSAPVRRTATATRVAALERNAENERNATSNFARSRYFSSLPPPIVFDGPARPSHLLPPALEKRRKLRQCLSLSPNRQAHTPSPPFISTSEPVYEIFDGPSRMTPHKYPRLSSQSSSLPYVCLALGISGAIGWISWTTNNRAQEHLHKRA